MIKSAKTVTETVKKAIRENFKYTLLGFKVKYNTTTAKIKITIKRGLFGKSSAVANLKKALKQFAAQNKAATATVISAVQQKILLIKLSAFVLKIKFATGTAAKKIEKAIKPDKI